MHKLEFSLIGEPTPPLLQALRSFEKQTGATIQLHQMAWEKAWSELLTYALYGQGPDVSHVGSTWAGSLVAMNALRPFTAAEVKEVGGARAFLPASWHSCTWPSASNPGQQDIWSLPWTSYTFVLCYRRDLLQAAGIDEKLAFQSAAAVEQTLSKLKTSGVDLPWVVPIDPELVDCLHHVASWVWGAGGDFISVGVSGVDPVRILFNQPAAQNAIQDYFKLLTFTRSSTAAPASGAILDETAAQRLFSHQGAAVTLVGSGAAYLWLNSRAAAPEVLENLGVTPVPGIPWIGGDNLVIWKHTLVSPERERLAVKLAQFLVSQEIQQSLCQSEDVLLPTRLDAFPAIPLPESPLTRAVIHSLNTGRAYPPMAMWGRFESQMGQMLGKLGLEILAGTTVEATVSKHLDSLGRRLELMLAV